MKFKTFMEQMVQKKNISVEYGRNDVVTKLTVNGKLVKGFSLSIPEYSKMGDRQFMYSKPQKFYISSFRRSEIILNKEIWDSVKEVNNVRF